MNIQAIIEAAKRLRLRKAPLRFRPQLIYLVDTRYGYVSPRREGYISGQTAWLDRDVRFQCHKDAKDFADAQPASDKAKVVKLNVCAFEESIIK